MINVEIKKMIPEHIDGVMVVEHLSFSIPWSRNAFMEELLSNKFAIYVTAFYEDMVIGYGGMWKLFDEGHITNIAVHPEYRKCNVGSKIMDKLLEISKEEQIHGLTLEVRKSNISAQKLYGKYGFETEGIRKGYYADNGEDALIMWLHNI